MTGEEFRQLRKRAGVSVQACARELGVSERTIKRWQKARFVPDPAVRLFKTLHKLGDVDTAKDGGGAGAGRK